MSVMALTTSKAKGPSTQGAVVSVHLYLPLLPPVRDRGCCAAHIIPGDQAAYE